MLLFIRNMESVVRQNNIQQADESLMGSSLKIFSIWYTPGQAEARSRTVYGMRSIVIAFS